ncbi:MAG: tetratricopeptide repeat protein [bacterium]|nr:tetratricopeptide repeat protein [bacterium]
MRFSYTKKRYSSPESIQHKAPPLIAFGVFFMIAFVGVAFDASLRAETSGATKTETKQAPADKETKQPAANAKSDAKQKKPALPPVYQPTPEEIEAAEKRIALKQTTAELVVAYKYQLRTSVPYLMRKLKAVAPDSPEMQYFTALGLYEKGERGRALIQLKEATYRAPHFSRAWNLRGIILSEADRLPEARSAFEAAVQHNPYNPNYVYNLASVLYRLGDQPAAEQSAKRSIKLKANLSEGYYLIARIHRDRKEYGPALLAFKQANLYGQKSQDFLLDYLLAAEAGGDEKVVPDLADRLAGVRDPRTLRELARIYSRFGEYKKAAERLNRLLPSKEAKAADRQAYVRALHKSKAKPRVIKGAILRIPKIKAKEREALLEYQRTLEDSDRTKPGTRDPMLKPIK